MKPPVLPFLRVGLVAVLCSALSVGSAPVLPSSLDVELVDIKPEDGDDIVQSSMITPFPSGNPGGGLQPDEPNFFWSGSGDDPDAGMTYWITTTVYKTAVVTMTPMTPKPSITTATTSIAPTAAITPTPPTMSTVSPPTWPVEAFQPRNWIRTVIRSDADESSPRFRQLLQSRLGRIYSDLLQRNTTTTTQQRTHVIIQNITRKANDIDVIYALWNWAHHQGGGHPSSYYLVEPYVAVGAVVRRGDVTRQLCHRQVNDTQQDMLLLCQSVVTQAEPFVRAEETSVAAAASGNQQYWIAGAIVGAIIVLVLIAALIYLIGRNGKTIRDKKDVAVGESPVLPKAEKLVSKQSSNLPGRFSRSSSKKTKSVEKSSTPPLPDVENHPDPWVRKARSTSKKHQRDKHRRTMRPQTAPERNAHRQSSSSLSAIVSGSASSASSSVDRMEYRLSREEPVQPSRGARRLKQKRSSKTDPILSSEKSLKKQEAVVVEERPVPKPRHRVDDASIEMETQEVTADFMDHPDSPDEDPPSPQPKQTATTEDFGWRPGSLIPARVTAGVFGSRKVSSAPVPLQGSKDGRKPVQHHRRAWSSSDQLELPMRPTSNNVDIVMPTTYESSGNENSDSRTTSVERQPPQSAKSASQLRNPSLHIHSISYPAWPSLSDTDPAIELIRSIKEELKKFEPKVS